MFAKNQLEHGGQFASLQVSPKDFMTLQKNVNHRPRASLPRSIQPSNCKRREKNKYNDTMIIIDLSSSEDEKVEDNVQDQFKNTHYDTYFQTIPVKQKYSSREKTKPQTSREYKISNSLQRF